MEASSSPKRQTECIHLYMTFTHSLSLGSLQQFLNIKKVIRFGSIAHVLIYDDHNKISPFGFSSCFGTNLDKQLDAFEKQKKHIPSTILKATTPYPMMLLEKGLGPIELVNFVRVYNQVT